MCRLLKRWRRHAPPKPSDEALKARDEVEAMKPRVERAVRERERLLLENNYTARIRALYEGRQA